MIIIKTIHPMKMNSQYITIILRMNNLKYKFKPKNINIYWALTIFKEISILHSRKYNKWTVLSSDKQGSVQLKLYLQLRLWFKQGREVVKQYNLKTNKIFLKLTKFRKTLTNLSKSSKIQTNLITMIGKELQSRYLFTKNKC